MNNIPPIKIVFGLPSFLVGGIEKHLLQQLHHFNQKKYKFFLITLFDYPDRPHLFDALPAGVTCYRLHVNGYFDFRNMVRLFRILKEISPDIVVTSMFSANALFRVLKIFLRYKIIIREHNTYTDKTRLHFFIDWALSFVTTQIVAVSEQVRLFVAQKSHIPLKKIKVIQNGVDIKKIEAYKSIHDKQEARRSLGYRNNDRIILNVARLKPQKNHYLLLEAHRKLYASYQNTHVVIVGSGSEKPLLEEYIKKHNLQNVHLVGYTENVYLYYRAADVFALTSDREGFPNVCIEALAFGLPVVSTPVAGVDEFISNKKNGIIVDRTVDDVVRALNYFLSPQDDWSRTHDTCVNTARLFSLELNIQRYEDLFDSII